MALDQSPEAKRIQHEIRQTIYYKSFMITGCSGWYLEFGAFEGRSFASAYHAARQVYEETSSNFFGADKGDRGGNNNKFNARTAQWLNMRFVAFDSFEGIPAATNKVDKHYEVFTEGQYSCSEEDFMNNVRKSGVNPGQVITVPGYFDKTLNRRTAERIGLKQIAVAHIDSDLYESAVLALDFCTPYFMDGSIVIFDEWFQFRGNPFLGEQRAFREWRKRNPDWFVSEHQQQGAFSKSFILSRKPEL